MNGTATGGGDLARRVALVVGASRGIGAATAAAFADAGAKVVAAGRDLPALQALADRLGAAGHRALAVGVDVTDEASTAALVERTVAAYGRLDIAFNNANHTPPPAPLAEIDTAAFDQAIATSIRGTFLCMRHQIPAMVDTGGGAIVNVASVAGVTAVAGLAAYVTGKAGIIALSKTAALDYAASGVRVNVVAPGPIASHRFDHLDDDTLRRIAHTVPLGRIGTVGEVAAAVTWLCSDRSSFVTGAVLAVDGGRTAGEQRPNRPTLRP